MKMEYLECAAFLAIWGYGMLSNAEGHADPAFPSVKTRMGQTKEKKMNKFMVVAGATLLAGVITGCATGGLSKDAEQDVVTKIWYDNADILVEANDPDLKADAYTGVTSVDAIVDTVKDILVQVPVWTVAKVEQKHFDSAYMEAAKAINGGADGADLVVKGEAFKTVLLFDTFAQLTVMPLRTALLNCPAVLM